MLLSSGEGKGVGNRTLPDAGCGGHAGSCWRLGQSDVAFEIPGLGAFAGANITPDKATGIGEWSVQQIVTATASGDERLPSLRLCVFC
jgi:hypothetical protein